MQAASIAPHWAGAHEWLLAADAYMAAARQAQSASQRGHEVEHWQAAQACFDKAGDADQSFDARCESIPALIVVHGVAHANGVIDALLTEAHTDRQRVAALTARAMAALMAADHETGVAAAVQAGELARRLDSPWPCFEAARLHAVGLAQGGHTSDALAVIEPFRETVERDGNVEHKAHFWSDYAYVLNTARRLRDTAFALERAIDNTRAQGDLAELATLISNLATVKGNLGSADEALDLAQRAMALQVQLGTTDGPAGGVVETYVGLYCGMVGRYADALERLDSAIARFERDGQKTWIAVANNHKVCLLMQLGQFARARQALDHDAPSVDSVRARGVALAARLDRVLGQTSDGGLHRALDILSRGGDPHVRMQTLLDEAERLDAALSVVATSWGYVTGSTLVKPSRTMGVGFWQRASGARPGVGAVFVSEMEYQLPEASPNRLRSATFQFSGKPSQCVGNEPVVVDVYAYVADGKADVADTTVGSKIATLTADCTDQAAFSRPIDVTHIVRQTTVASGIRFVGFNVRKANNRQGPGLFALAAGKLTVVIADQDIHQQPVARAGGGAGKTTPVAGLAPAMAVQARPAVVQPSMRQQVATSGTSAPARKAPASAPVMMGRNQVQR